MMDNMEMTKYMEERMERLAPADRCALFLLSSVGADENGSLDGGNLAANRASALLKKFFKDEEVLGALEDSHMAAFLSGKLSGDQVAEKAAVLSEALQLSKEDLLPGVSYGYVGVYLFQAGEKNPGRAIRKAEYALELARRERKRYYICISEGAESNGVRLSGSAYSSRLLHDIDEGIRLLRVGKEIEAVYASPSFCYMPVLKNADGEAWDCHVHPADREVYEQTVRKAALTGKPEDGRYRILDDSGLWTACRFRFLKIPSSDGYPAVLEISHNVDGLELLKYKYDEKQEWMRFLTEQEDCQFWEADLRTRTFRLLYTRNLMEGREMNYENFPESMIENGRVHLDSAEPFRKFAEDIYAGKPEGHGNFIIQYRQSSCYGWASLSYRMLYDKDGRPEKAIGIKEDLSYLPSRQSKFIQRRIMPADLYPHLYGYFQANLSSDVVEKFQLEGREQIRLIRYRTYTEIVEEGVLRFFEGESGKRIQERFGREKLLQEFAGGRRWFVEQSRAVHFDGTICRILAGINLTADPETGDVCLFAYLLDDNRQQEWEAGLKSPALRDQETGLLSADALKDLSERLAAKYEDSQCAFVSIRIVGAEDLFADEKQVRKERDILTALHVFLGADCLAGQSGRGRLNVVIPHTASQSALRRKLENAFFFTRISLGDMEDMLFLRLVAGVAYADAGCANVERMEREADRLCELHTAAASDMVAFQEEGSRPVADAGLEQDAEELEPHVLESDHLMTETDKDAALECMGLMLRAEDADSSVNSVLEKIGNYYQADRAYILALTENAQIVTMLNEWTGKGKYSIQHSVSGKRTEQFPAIARCAKSREPVILSVNRAEGQEGWQYAAFPMGNASGPEQLLCMENPRKHIEHTALLDQILPYLVRERKRFQNAKAVTSPMDRLFSLANSQAYLDIVYSLNSDTCISMGVLTVDIPEYSAVKNQKGYEYGSRFLLKISEALINVFGKKLLYHTQEAEFTVLAKDTTYETFLNQCAHVRHMINVQYAGQFRMGTIWSDGIFRARDLVEKARSMMKCVGVGEQDVPEASGDDWGTLFQSKNPLLKLQDEGCFTIYLQPKVDMRSGKLTGAEALFRVMDEKGNLISHSRVIESMEKEGTIQDVDYFVFDKALYALNQWKKKGYSLMPISSNFSRNTLLNPSSLASVLAIMSRYPDIPEDMVELEITETAGDYGNRTISELIKRFGKYGLNFALDDLGSSYSNLSMLADLRFHSVKLDRSLVRNISGNKVSRIMVRDIVKICKKRGMNCIAEGVETKEQADTLMEDGLKYAQGYLYGRPMPLQEFERTYLQG